MIRVCCSCELLFPSAIGDQFTALRRMGQYYFLGRAVFGLYTPKVNGDRVPVCARVRISGGVGGGGRVGARATTSDVTSYGGGSRPYRPRIGNRKAALGATVPAGTPRPGRKKRSYALYTITRH